MIECHLKISFNRPKTPVVKSENFKPLLLGVTLDGWCINRECYIVREIRDHRSLPDWDVLFVVKRFKSYSMEYRSLTILTLNLSLDGLRFLLLEKCYEMTGVF